MAEVGADLGRRERQGAVNLGGEALVLQSGDLRPRESRARPGGGGGGGAGRSPTSHQCLSCGRLLCFFPRRRKYYEGYSKNTQTRWQGIPRESRFRYFLAQTAPWLKLGCQWSGQASGGPAE